MRECSGARRIALFWPEHPRNPACRTQVLAVISAHTGAARNDGIQDGLKLRDIMMIGGAVIDDRAAARDATRVSSSQQILLLPFFSASVGFGRDRILGPARGALKQCSPSSTLCQRHAMPSISLIRQPTSSPSKARKNRGSARHRCVHTRGTQKALVDRAQHCRSAPRAVLSPTGSLCAARTRSPRIQHAARSVCAHPRAGVDICVCSDVRAAAAPAAPPSARMRPILPKRPGWPWPIAFSEARSDASTGKQCSILFTDKLLVRGLDQYIYIC